MTTNVYIAHYEDLTQLSVNAETLTEAVTSFAKIKDVEPMLLQRKITGIKIPDAPTPLPTANIVCTAEREEEDETLPTTVTVRPVTPIARTSGSTVTLYAIDTATEPSVVFAGWYLGDELLSTEPEFAYVIPEGITDGETITLTAKFKAKPITAVYTVTLATQRQSDPATALPASCTVRPNTPTAVTSGTALTVYAIATNPAYTFIAWQDADGNELSADATYTFTPTRDITLIALFDEV